MTRPWTLGNPRKPASGMSEKAAGEHESSSRSGRGCVAFFFLISAPGEKSERTLRQQARLSRDSSEKKKKEAANDEGISPDATEPAACPTSSTNKALVVVVEMMIKRRGGLFGFLLICLFFLEKRRGPIEQKH